MKKYEILKNKKLKEQFDRDYAANAKRFIKSGEIVALIIWISAVTISVIVYGDQAYEVKMVFLSVLFPIQIINIYLVNSKHYEKWGFLATSVANMFAGLFVVYASYLLLENPYFLIFGLAMVISFILIYQKIPFRYSFFGTFVYLSYFQYIIYHNIDLDFYDKITMSFIVWIIYIFSVVGLFVIRYLQKDIFIKDLTILNQHEKLIEEKENTEKLLINILPSPVAKRLINGEFIADRIPCATVLFANIEGFENFSSTHKPEEAVSLLNTVFSIFDDLAEKHSIEKIKTIGSSYMAVGGVLGNSSNHIQKVADMALDMIDIFKEISEKTDKSLKLRVGINSGTVIAGVIGKKKFLYDLWSDAVNIASRMESNGVAGKIQVSESSYKLLNDNYKLVMRGNFDMKGKGAMRTFFLISKKSS